MLRERLPAGTETRDVELRGHGLTTVPGRAVIRRWTRPERVRRGFRLSARLLLPIMGLLLPLGFLEPFLFLIWGSVVYAAILLIAGPLLFAKYSAEEVSFFHVEAACPHCR